MKKKLLILSIFISFAPQSWATVWPEEEPDSFVFIRGSNASREAFRQPNLQEQELQNLTTALSESATQRLKDFFNAIEKAEISSTPFAKIEYLKISDGADFEQVDLSLLARLPNLKELIFCAEVTPSALAQLKNITLNELKFGGKIYLKNQQTGEWGN